MFGVLFVYMVICLVLYLQTEHVTAYEVTAGPLTGNYRYTALTLKSEVLVKASQSGTVSYYAREGQKVGMGNGVCSVDVSGKQRDIVKNMEAGLTGDNPEMILKLRSQMSTFAMNYDSVSYQAVYNFRSDVESSILELANVSSLSDPEAWGIENLYTAPQEGIVVYSMDGYENMQAESVKQADFDQMAYQKTNFRVNGTVSNGDCLYKLLTDEKCEILFNKSKWIGDRIFAFDNIKDREIIEKKLHMIRKYTNNQIKFYTFCGYNHDNIGVYDEEFWVKDIEDLFERIKILMTYGCLPYVMRFKDYVLSPYKGIYINAASWCNQPSLFRKMSFAEYSMARGMSNKNYKKYKMDFDSYLADGNKKGSSWRYYEKFLSKYPEIAEKYFHMKWNYSNRNS